MKTQHAPASPQPETQIRKVLLVDDHPMVRGGLAQIISQQSDLSVCGEARDAGEALDRLAAGCPDLAVVDISLEGRSGLDLLKDLRVLYPALPVLVMSMHDENLYAERVLRAGGRGYVMKRAGGEVILEAIRRVLDGQIYVSREVSVRILNSVSGRRPNHSPIQKLTDREFEIFCLIGEGKSTRDIAHQLHLSPKTIDVHRARIKQRLGVRDSPSLICYAVRWVETEDRPSRGRGESLRVSAAAQAIHPPRWSPLDD